VHSLDLASDEQVLAHLGRHLPLDITTIVYKAVKCGQYFPSYSILDAEENLNNPSKGDNSIRKARVVTTLSPKPDRRP